MDPSDIISTPFPLHQLCKFVALSIGNVFVSLIICKMMLIRENDDNRNHSSTKQSTGKKLGILHIILVVGLSTIIIHVFFIICGIHPTKLPLHTLVSAFYVAFNMLFPILVIAPQNQYSNNNVSLINQVIFTLKDVSIYIYGPSSLINEQTNKKKDTEQQKHQQHRIQQIHQFTTLGSLLGMVVCTILRILDHGMQIQRYPIPIIVGATYGSCGGVFIVALIQTMSERS